MTDDKNPKYIFSGTDTELLSMAVRGKINLKALAHYTLMIRGLDLSGKWIGFEAAEKLHKKYMIGSGLWTASHVIAGQ